MNFTLNKRVNLFLKKLYLSLLEAPLIEAYFMGYDGVKPFRWVRRGLAKTPLHRSWLAGNMGSYYEGGRKLGVCDRYWYSYRN